MRRGYADTPEGQVHYYTEGEGEPLLLLHQTGSSRGFWKLMPLLAKEYRVIALDNLGSGNSDPLPPRASVKDIARSLIHAMDDLGIDKAHIFGLHTGNKVGTEIAAGWPTRVDGLVLCGNTHSIMADQKELIAAVKAVMGTTLQRFDPAPDGSHLIKQWTAEFSQLAAVWWDTNTLSHQELTPELFERRKERIIDSLQLKDNREKYEAVYAFDLGTRMRDIKAKTLVIEIRVPTEQHLQAQGPKLVKLIPNSSLATVEHTTGGMPMEVKAEEFARLILGHLQTVRQSRTTARR